MKLYTIKPLVWKYEGGYETANGVGNWYRVWPGGWQSNEGDHYGAQSGDAPTIELAKRAADAHWIARVEACLLPVTVRGDIPVEVAPAKS